MNLCMKLHAAKDDEAEAVIEYAKLKNLMPSDHEEHINTIDGIMLDEHRHLLEILEIIKEMKCVDPTAIQEICMIAKVIYEKANKIEKLSEYVDSNNGEDGRRLKQIAEDLESLVKQIKIIAKK